MKNIVHTIKRVWGKINRIIRWIPIIWKSEDWDSGHAIDVFKFKLKEIEKYLSDESKCYSVNHKHHASRVRTAIKLMDKVYDEEYALEYFDKMKKLYGKSEIEFVETEDSKDKEERFKLYTLVYKYEKDYTDDEIAKIESHRNELFLESHKKQERAHKLLWDFIEHNIRHWWD